MDASKLQLTLVTYWNDSAENFVCSIQMIWVLFIHCWNTLHWLPLLDIVLIGFFRAHMNWIQLQGTYLFIFS